MCRYYNAQLNLGMNVKWSFKFVARTGVKRLTENANVTSDTKQLKYLAITSNIYCAPANIEQLSTLV